MALPPPAKLSRLQERLRTSLLAERNSTAATRRRLVRPAVVATLSEADTFTGAKEAREQLPAGNALIALRRDLDDALRPDPLCRGDQLRYTKQNCTCDFDCPCELIGDDGREALWCGCEQIFNCTCEMRSGACTVGPPDDSYLFFPGTTTGTGGYLAALRGEALDFAGNQSFTLEAWVRPYKFSQDAQQTLLSRYNNQVAGQWILYLDGAKRLCFQRDALAEPSAPPPASPSRVTRSAGAATQGPWTHVAVYDLSNSSRLLLLNGTAVVSDLQETRRRPTASPSSRRTWGYMPADLFEGEIDDVRVWRQARTQREVAAFSTFA